MIHTLLCLSGNDHSAAMSVGQRIVPSTLSKEEKCCCFVREIECVRSFFFWTEEEGKCVSLPANFCCIFVLSQLMSWAQEIRTAPLCVSCIHTHML